MKLSAATKTLRKVPFITIGKTPVSTLNDGHKITAFVAGDREFRVHNHKILPAFQKLEAYIKSKKLL